MDDRAIAESPQMLNSPPPENEGLQRKLRPRQLTMMAIGGAIGVGLFLGSSVTIELAGPGVIVSYVLGALVAMVVAYSLAEMAVVHPVAGSFGVYAETYLSPWAGFTVRVTYGVVQIIAIGAEVTAVAIYFGFWFPQIPAWTWVCLVSLGLVTLNALQVSNFGEFEYWFALIKVVAIIIFIVVGFALITGLGPWPAVGLANLTRHGGFLPHGWRGVWLALTLALTSYMGVEVIAVTAGEAQDPQTSIPRAMRTVVFRLIIFYVCAVSVMLAMTPWNQTGGATISGSPFVRAFGTVGIPFAASLMNIVVITAALSSANTNLYLSTRMLFSLSRSRYMPPLLGHLSRNGVPHYALGISTGGMIAAILLAIFAPTGAFLLLYGTAVAGMFFVWIVILMTHLGFRRTLSPESIASLPLRLPAHPVFSVLGMVALSAIVVTTFFVEGLRGSVPIFLVFLVMMSVMYLRVRRKAV
ncbi:MAG TPA: amino acid permease [Terriglobales bacterium]|nr:amino acid permease [Terriglobales bacterium]